MSLSGCANKGGVRLILVDLSGATDVSQLAAAQTLDIEDVNKGPSSLGITAAATSVVFDEFENSATRLFPTYKLGGSPEAYFEIVFRG